MRTCPLVGLSESMVRHGSSLQWANCEPKCSLERLAGAPIVLLMSTPFGESQPETTRDGNGHTLKLASLFLLDAIERIFLERGR